MNKILIIFAHPAFHKSRINKKLVNKLQDVPGVVFHDLYENYPDFFINVKKEQELLLENDIIIWQHPFYWYSCPSLLKEWIDLVLEHNFAYGEKGNALKGKKVISIISTGGSKKVYCEKGTNHYTINQFLAPFIQTANLCKMEYLPPFVIHESFNISENNLMEYAEKYYNLLIALRSDNLKIRTANENSYINEMI